MIEKYQFMYLCGIAVGWGAHRYFNLSGGMMAFGLLLSVPIYFTINYLWP